MKLMAGWIPRDSYSCVTSIDINTYPNEMWMFLYYKQYIWLIICNMLPIIPLNSVFHIMIFDIITAYENQVFKTFFRPQF